MTLQWQRETPPGPWPHSISSTETKDLPEIAAHASPPETPAPPEPARPPPPPPDPLAPPLPPPPPPLPPSEQASAAPTSATHIQLTPALTIALTSAPVMLASSSSPVAAEADATAQGRRGRPARRQVRLLLEEVGVHAHRG